MIRMIKLFTANYSVNLDLFYLNINISVIKKIYLIEKTIIKGLEHVC